MAPYREPTARLDSNVADQGGYFTAQQAKTSGYSYRAQHYQTSVGEWERVACGIYRLSSFPAPVRGDLIIFMLKSHNRAGEPQAVVSHDSAFAIHELGDIDPAAIHVTVPARFRKRVPAGVVLHVARLDFQDWEEREGYRVITPLRTLVDAADDALSQEILDAASETPWTGGETAAS
jgi:predicted transcriptional regulator of viral defense system